MNRNFLERDRLQSGLAAGLLVVEAGEKSGIMHAVREALDLGKPIGCFAFDEAHYSKYPDSLGNKLLINEGKADSLGDEESIWEFINRGIFSEG